MNSNIRYSMFFMFILLLFSCVSELGANVKLPAIISDNMVLQADKEIKIWGWADPKEEITVTIDKQSINTKADDKGKWLVKLKLLKAVGPYEMTVTGKNTIIVKNILIGEVWLASGQSNMQWNVGGTMNADQEIKNASYPNIRLFTVPNICSILPLDDVKGQWFECSPSTVKWFSAVAYFFGRNIHEKLNVPVGLINSSWGGTAAEAWTSWDALESNSTLKPMLDRYTFWEIFKKDEYRDKLNEISRDYKGIEELKIKDPGNTGFDKGWANLDFDSSLWQEMVIPNQWENNGLDVDGAVWFRREVDIPESWVGEDLTIYLGVINDTDTAYFNGNKIGETNIETPKYWRVSRKYNIPASIVKAGKNVVAIRVFNNFASGGILNSQEKIRIFKNSNPVEDKRTLVGKWKYQVESGVEQKPIPQNPLNQNDPTVLFNAMINPLTNFAIRGAIWYQGESNAGRAYQYRTLFPVMIEDWRKRWNDKFAFLFVQLANFMQRRPMPSESSWAQLREAQLMTLSLPNTGMAVIIDIGDEKDIHPKNKQDVGLRLALPALAKVYGKKDVVYSGPIYKSMKIEGNKIRLSFEHIGGGLVAKGDELKGFAIAGEDKKFYWANAVIDGDSIVVSSANVEKPIAVRYAWQDNPECNLYNKADLPASPFRTDEW